MVTARQGMQSSPDSTGFFLTQLAIFIALTTPVSSVGGQQTAPELKLIPISFYIITPQSISVPHKQFTI